MEAGEYYDLEEGELIYSLTERTKVRQSATTVYMRDGILSGVVLRGVSYFLI